MDAFSTIARSNYYHRGTATSASDSESIFKLSEVLSAENKMNTSIKFQTISSFVSGQILALGGWSPNYKTAEYYDGGSWIKIGDYPFSGSVSKFSTVQTYRKGFNIQL